nr:MAG TPA: hypothetical protein [Caudoviricetes sp.]
MWITLFIFYCKIRHYLISFNWQNKKTPTKFGRGVEV